MGRLKIGAVEKAMCGGRESLKVPAKVSSKFVIVGYIPIVSMLFFKKYLIVLLAKLC